MIINRIIGGGGGGGAGEEQVQFGPLEICPLSKSLDKIIQFLLAHE